MGAAACLTLLTVLAFGLVSARTGERIVGGSAAGRGFSRRLALIRTEFRSGNTASCTATVLDRRWLLTAAHCVAGASIFTPLVPRRSYALVGERRPSATAASDGTQPLYFARVFVHKSFRRATNDFRFDIAVIKLRQAIPEASYYPIEIAAPPPPDSVVKAVGYGVTGGTSAFAPVVQVANVIVKPVRDCARKERPAIAKFLRKSKTVCAVSMGYPDEGRTDTCYGDSGGPLFYRKNGRLVQFATTSFSTSGCAEPGGHGYYTRLDTYESVLTAKVRDGENGGAWKRIA